MAARLAHQLADHFLAVPITVDQPPIGFRLFNRVQILALDVLDQRDLGPRFLVEFANYRWNLMQLSSLRGSPPALASDQFIAISHRSDQDRLKYAPLHTRPCQPL